MRLFEPEAFHLGYFLKRKLMGILIQTPNATHIPLGFWQTRLRVQWSED